MAAGGPDDRRTARCRVASGASVSSRATGGRRAAGRASAWWSWCCWSAGGAGSSCGSSRQLSSCCFFGPRRRLAVEDIPPWPSTLALDVADVIDSRQFFEGILARRPRFFTNNFYVVLVFLSLRRRAINPVKQMLLVKVNFPVKHQPRVDHPLAPPFVRAFVRWVVDVL